MSPEKSFRWNYYLLLFLLLSLMVFAGLLNPIILVVLVSFVLLGLGILYSVRYLILSSRMIAFDGPVIYLRTIKREFSAHYDDILCILINYKLAKNNGPWTIKMIKKSYTEFEITIPQTPLEKQQKFEEILSRRMTLSVDTEKYTRWYGTDITDQDYLKYLKDWFSRNEMGPNEILKNNVETQLQELQKLYPTDKH